MYANSGSLHKKVGVFCVYFSLSTTAVMPGAGTAVLGHEVGEDERV